MKPSSSLEQGAPKLENLAGVQPANFQIGQPVVRPITERLYDEDIKFMTMANEEASQESRHVEGHFPNNPRIAKGRMVRLRLLSPSVVYSKRAY